MTRARIRPLYTRRKRSLSSHSKDIIKTKREESLWRIMKTNLFRPTEPAETASSLLAPSIKCINRSSGNQQSFQLYDILFTNFSYLFARCNPLRWINFFNLSTFSFFSLPFIEISPFVFRHT